MDESLDTPSPAGKRSGFLWVLLVFALSAAIGAGAWSALFRRSAGEGGVVGSAGSSSGSSSGSAGAPGAGAQSAVSPLLAGGEIPNFKLTERSGRMVTREELDGKVWIADFIFTRCPNVCPDLTRKMEIIRRKLAAEGAGDVVSVSISVDPVYDTPQIMAAYADQFHADPAGWLFLTGPPEDVYHLVTGGFQLAMQEPGQGPPAHSNRFVLVDAQGRMRATHAGNDDGVVDTVVKEALSLRKENRG
jgi:protein SCO1/2